jgi:hypothetical protein
MAQVSSRNRNLTGLVDRGRLFQSLFYLVGVVLVRALETGRLPLVHIALLAVVLVLRLV